MNQNPPLPTFPLSGAVVDSASVTFEWQGVPNAEDYLLQVAQDRQFARDITEVHTGGSTSVVLHDALAPTNHPYFWRIRSVGQDGESRWSPYGRFFAGSDAQVDAFRAREEATELQRRREAAQEQAVKEARLDLLPYVERDDTVPSARFSRIIVITGIISFLLVVASVLLATVM